MSVVWAVSANDQYQLSGCLAETGTIRMVVGDGRTNVTVPYTYQQVSHTVNGGTTGGNEHYSQGYHA
jgi:hypothetical protein